MPSVNVNAPYGGRLVDRQVSGAERERALAQARSLPALRLSDRSICDVICLGTGVYSPLDGFMGPADYAAIIESMHLANGLIWSIPITLPIGNDDLPAVRKAGKAALVAGDAIIAMLEVTDIFDADFEREAMAVYRTTEAKHPGVALIADAPKTLVAGRVTLFDAPTFGFPDEYRTPAMTRALFASLGWRT